MTIKKPKGVIFNDKIVRDCKSGDNWCMTWAADDNKYVFLDDGFGWNEEKHYNNRIYRIVDTPNGDIPFSAEDLPGYPDYFVERTGANDYLITGSWYGYGIVSVDGVLYAFITLASGVRFNLPFVGCKLIYSEDFGVSWKRFDGLNFTEDPRTRDAATLFFAYEDKEWPFTCIDIVQCGKDNQLAKDSYIYLYSPNGVKMHELNLARVKKDRILDKAAYEYFVKYARNGSAEWTPRIKKRGCVHKFPEGWGLYSWLPSVVYNKGLDLYIMATGGTQRPGTGDPNNPFMHFDTGSLGFYWSETPWGPWTEFYYTEKWYADSDSNRLYQPTLSPKWISDDGTEMVLIFSDAQADDEGHSHTTNYRWNHRKITLILE